MLAWFVGAACGMVAIICFFAPPNTTDAMFYHMPRVVYWFMNRGVGLYPSSDVNQLFQGPFAEYAILQTFILAHGDRFAPFVQWAGFTGCAVAASAIVRALGGSRFVQAFAAFLCATVPPAILQASGAKNDCYAAFWLLLTIYSGLRFSQTRTDFWAAVTGIALGCAMLTKGTMLIYAPLLLVTTVLLARLPSEAVLRLAFAVVIVAGGLNASQWKRNYTLSGSVLGFSAAHGHDADFRFRNDNLTPSGVTANIVRNAALHLATPSGGVNRLVEKATRNFLVALGCNPDDPASLWTTTTFAINDISRHEAVSPAPAHFWLFLLALGLLIYRRAWKSGWQLPVYAAGLVAVFVAFSALLRWQPWHTRLHIPFFMAACPLIALVICRYLPPWFVRVAAAVLAILAGPMLTENSLRPLWMPGNIFDQQRADLYFMDQPALRHSYQEVASMFQSGTCSDVGIDSSLYHIEYPLVALLEPGQGRLRLRQVGYGHLTEGFASAKAEPPCAVICLGCAGNEKKKQEYSGYNGRVHTAGNVMVFSRQYLVAGSGGCEVTFSKGWYPPGSVLAGRLAVLDPAGGHTQPAHDKADGNPVHRQICLDGDAQYRADIGQRCAGPGLAGCEAVRFSGKGARRRVRAELPE